MSNRLMAGIWRLIIPVPPMLWHKQISRERKTIARELAFMSDEHRLVHHFVVRELPRAGGPLPPRFIADKLSMTEERVTDILDGLEKHMTFLFRNDSGEVTWAYPVTVDQTPHRVTFSTGEQLYAAWAADAFATPFVQGRLREENLSVSVETQCAHCSQPMQVEIDSDLNYSVREEGANPLVFVPEVDVYRLEEPSIIESFWRQSVFLWSEEHAREYRSQVHRIRGAYFTSEQMAYLTRIIQSVLFGLEVTTE